MSAGEPKTKTDIIGPDHPISQLANILSDRALELSANLLMSRWHICQALANACGQILADSEDMPRAFQEWFHRGEELSVQFVSLGERIVRNISDTLDPGGIQ